MSAHRLMIEKGRHLGLSQAQRLCKSCNTNNIDRVGLAQTVACPPLAR